MTEITTVFETQTYSNSKWKAMFYHLNHRGGWNVFGTGHVSITKEPNYHLIMIDELEKKVLLNVSLNDLVEYHIQRDTIITWKNMAHEEDDDRAISFQESEGVREVWELICQIQGKDPYDSNGLCRGNQQLFDDVTLSNLPFINKELNTSLDQSKIKRINYEIMNNDHNFVLKIGKLLLDQEKKADEQSSIFSDNTNDLSPKSSPHDYLSIIFTIMKQLILIADRDVLMKLMTDDYYMITFGALEHDCDLMKTVIHRRYFNTNANFKNIFSIQDSDLINKIQLNHRLIYLRDVAIGKFIEELTFRNINLNIQTNNSDIIRFFLINKKYLEIIIEKLIHEDYQANEEALLFIVELINCSKELYSARKELFESLYSSGILYYLELLLHSINQKKDNYSNQIQAHIICIILSLFDNVPGQLKQYIISSLLNESFDLNDSCLVKEITQLFLNQKEFGILCEISMIIKTFLNKNYFYSPSSQCNHANNNLLNSILKYCLLPLTEHLQESIDKTTKYEKTAMKQCIMDILCYFIYHHGQEAVTWFINNQIIEKVVSCLENKSKVLIIQVIKFSKLMVMENNETLNNAIINSCLFDKLIVVFEYNKKQKNAIFSSLVDYIIFLKSIKTSSILSDFFIKNYESFLYNEKNISFFKDKEVINPFPIHCNINYSKQSLLVKEEDNYEKNNNNQYLGLKRLPHQDIMISCNNLMINKS